MTNNFPKTKKGKIELLKALMNGEVKLQDLKEPEIIVTMRFDSEPDHWHLVGDNRQLKPITDKEHEALTAGNNIHNVTLNIE